ncbi:MAG TPA: hypothetical protein VK797_07220, partial [Tepidisphaeraceae bacterium]|nr:hypothetical protein [Tepidisphaeraceae bacterium]
AGSRSASTPPIDSLFFTNRIRRAPVVTGAEGRHDRGVDSTNLNPEQVKKLCDELARQLHYLNKLCGRMQILRFPDDDPVWREATRWNRLQDLFDAARLAGQRSNR